MSANREASGAVSRTRTVVTLAALSVACFVGALLLAAFVTYVAPGTTTDPAILDLVALILCVGLLVLGAFFVYVAFAELDAASSTKEPS